MKDPVMTLHEIIILSFVQGFTEFLPISSSGHLILIPHLLGWKDQGLLNDVAMHLGTLLAVLVYFRKDVLDLIQGCLELVHGRINGGGRLFLMLVIATIPAVITGYSLSYFEINLRDVKIIAFATLVFGIVLYVADRVGPLTKQLNQMSYLDAFVVGLGQAFALIPGTSRSGACLTIARFKGFNRIDSARFSFLMSIPTILAAATHTALKACKSDTLILNTEVVLCIGFSALFGFMAIHFMMYWLKKSTMTLFVTYRILLGIFLVGYIVKGP